MYNLTFEVMINFEAVDDFVEIFVYQIWKDFFGTTDDSINSSDSTVSGQQVDIEDHIQLSHHFLRAPTRWGLDVRMIEKWNLLLVKEA